MATLADSLVSSSARKMPVRMRPDLSARQHRYLGRSYWVVKDPVGLNYFRFQDEEWAILQMIDGQSSLDEIKDRFEAEFPPQKITLEELQQFLGMLHRSGLIIADVPGQGHQLRKRRDERRRKELLGALTNILCIRFKGFDPERLLNWMYPAFRWFFAPATVILCLLFMASAEQQRFRALDAGYLPTIPSVYDDPEIAAKQPIVARWKSVFMTAVPRPSAPTKKAYSEVSSDFWVAVHDTLAGSGSAADNLAKLEAQLTKLKGAGW